MQKENSKHWNDHQPNKANQTVEDNLRQQQHHHRQPCLPRGCCTRLCSTIPT